jgi:hypothetical protein
MDTKSASILGVCIIIAAIILSLKPSNGTEPKQNQQQMGRFQMCGVPGHAYVIDTETGGVWEKFATQGEGRTSSGFNGPKLK